MKISELRIKIKSLAVEARIIAHEERRVLRRLTRQGSPERQAAILASYASLREHRRAVVGPTARVSLLAYGFLRGKPYTKLEPSNSREPDWNDVWKVAERFAAPSGGRLAEADHKDLAQRWASWKAEAKKYRAA